MSEKISSSPDYAGLARLVVAACAEGNGEAVKNKGLYVVPTPIGNRGDITLRALQTLASVDGVLCEDTRVTGGLLHSYGIKRPLVALHDHNESDRIDVVLQRLAAGESLALVSDAGMPLIADPGFKLIRAVRQAGHDVTVLPGPSAFVTALAGSGLPTDRFAFHGFVPAKAEARRKFLAEAVGWRVEAWGSGIEAAPSNAASLVPRPPTLIFYETAPRLVASLTAMAEIFCSTRDAVVARELTKLFEDYRSGTLAELAAHYAAQPAKGEIVILIAPPTDADRPAVDLDALLRNALETHTLRDAVALVVKETGLKKSVVYQQALKLTS